MMSEIDFNISVGVPGDKTEGSDPAVLQANFDRDPVLFRDLLLDDITVLKKYKKELAELDEAEAFILSGGLNEAELITFMRSLKLYSKRNDEAYILEVIRFEQADRRKNIGMLERKIRNATVIYNKPENVQKFFEATNAFPDEDK